MHVQLRLWFCLESCVLISLNASPAWAVRPISIIASKAIPTAVPQKFRTPESSPFIGDEIDLNDVDDESNNYGTGPLADLPVSEGLRSPFADLTLPGSSRRDEFSGENSLGSLSRDQQDASASRSDEGSSIPHQRIQESTTEPQRSIGYPELQENDYQLLMELAYRQENIQLINVTARTWPAAMYAYHPAPDPKSRGEWRGSQVKILNGRAYCQMKTCHAPKILGLSSKPGSTGIRRPKEKEVTISRALHAVSSRNIGAIWYRMFVLEPFQFPGSKFWVRDKIRNQPYYVFDLKYVGRGIPRGKVGLYYIGYDGHQFQGPRG